ncbi:hypothetical protein SLEP1_g22236 [Rubroshorea leprosula]|uniref:Late embryogenesis abundant protein n=1 Tax=Rubroshorea leprosula TaxID=152421 RepID=A0AAV5JJE8_9ROSI|nr:hypothetical protein SLEP1_g22236 [Rubroshorea leprosula]
MEAMFITKSRMFTLSKAFPQSPSTLRSAPKVSRVFFNISASKYGGTNPYAESRNSRADMACSEAADRASRMSDTDDDAFEETMEKEKQYANETKEKAKDGTYKEVETAENITERAKERAKEGVDCGESFRYHTKREGEG